MNNNEARAFLFCACLGSCTGSRIRSLNNQPVHNENRPWMTFLQIGELCKLALWTEKHNKAENRIDQENQVSIKQKKLNSKEKTAQKQGNILKEFKREGMLESVLVGARVNTHFFFGFIKRAGKGRITTVKDLESWHFELLSYSLIENVCQCQYLVYVFAVHTNHQLYQIVANVLCYWRCAETKLDKGSKNITRKQVKGQIRVQFLQKGANIELSRIIYNLNKTQTLNSMSWENVLLAQISTSHLLLNRLRSWNGEEIILRGTWQLRTLIQFFFFFFFLQ